MSRFADRLLASIGFVALSAMATDAYAQHAATPSPADGHPPASSNAASAAVHPHAAAGHANTHASDGTHAAEPIGTSGHGAMEHSAMDHATAVHPATDQQAMDHSVMQHAGSHGAAEDPASEHAKHAAAMPAAMDDAPTDDVANEHAQTALPFTPIPTITDTDRAAAFPPLQHGMRHDGGINSSMQLELEGWDASGSTAQAWDVEAWLGSDTRRLWLRSEGERLGGRTDAAQLEVLYGHSVSAWWDVVAGIRQETRPDGRGWAAIGVQGLAPNKFETRATLYVDQSGRMEADVQVEYELLLTNRLILEPSAELRFAANNDPRRGIGSGLSSAEAGLRLRYEITRRIAPYVGLVHERAFGGTAAFQRNADEDARDTRVVLGLRTWF